MVLLPRGLISEPLLYMYPTTSGSIRFIDLRMSHHCKPITLIKFLMRFSVP